MVYTELKNKNERKYYYRVLSIRNGKKFAKKRKYLGVNLSKKEIIEKEKQADEELLKDENKKIQENIKKIKSKIIPILKKNKVKRAGIFGSFVRGEQKKNSDIDILIEPTRNMGFAFVGLQLELQNKLGKKIDLVSYNGISPHLKEKILNEEVKII